jgi:parallel beta helix pectate lyase-like protein
VFTRALRARLVPVCLGLGFAIAMVGAASASAATLYVSNTTPVLGGRSCAQPDYSSVQAAIESGPNAKISVCPGTYTEQLTITGPVKLSDASGPGTATIAMPAVPALSTTSCDTLDALEQIDEVSICTTGTVGITGLDIAAVVPLETCNYGFNGIFVAGGGTLTATDVAVDGAGTSVNDAKGCQHGVAVAVGLKTPAEVGHATLKDVDVFGYEKNGPTARGAGSTMAVTGSTITGEGATPYIAQNGIEVAYGAQGSVKSSTISGNECDVASCGASGEQASGALFYGAASGSNVTSSTLTENDLGAYYDSTSATQPSSPEVMFTKDVLTSNRYEGFVLEQGKALLSRDIVDGSGDVGIELIQYEGQTLASRSSAVHTKVEDQTEAAIKVESDDAPHDIEGSFDFTSGTFSGDATVLDNESNDFEVVL